MLILVLNAGSSSLKFNLMDMDREETLAEGIAERIGLSEGFMPPRKMTRRVCVPRPGRGSWLLAHDRRPRRSWARTA